MSPWGWRPNRTQGIWQHGALWFRQLAAISPWASVAVCLMTMYVVGDSLTLAPGTLFDLPDAHAAAGERTDLVAVAMLVGDETVLFFDDARYTVGDRSSVHVFGENLAERIDRSSQTNKTLMVLADRRVPGGDISRIADIARQSGVKRILLANRHAEDSGE